MSSILLDISENDESSKYIVNEIIRVCAGRLTDCLTYNSNTLLNDITSQVFNNKNYSKRDEPQDEFFKKLKSSFIGMISERVKTFLDSQEGQQLIRKKTETLIEEQVNNFFKFSVDKKEVMNKILEKLLATT
jgi:hypothetical protein